MPGKKNEDQQPAGQPGQKQPDYNPGGYGEDGSGRDYRSENFQTDPARNPNDEFGGSHGDYGGYRNHGGYGGPGNSAFDPAGNNGFDEKAAHPTNASEGSTDAGSPSLPPE